MSATRELVPGLSLVVPAHDEESRLPPTLEGAARALSGLARDCEIVVVDDGSTDATAEVARRADGAVPVRVFRLERNLGKGAAVARGVAEARHALVAFTDADCPYELGSLGPMLESLAAGRTEVAIGARDLSGSEVNRGYGPLRWLSGQALSLLTWLALGLPFRDSQCGLKAFRRDVARKLFAVRTVDGFGFDFEILAAAVANGLRVERFPVSLTHDDDSRISLVADSARMARDLLRVRRNLRRGAYALCAPGGAETPCPLCAGRAYSPRALRDGWRMVECASCGLWYLNPMPAREALASYYEEEYFATAEAQRGGYADYGAMADDLRTTFGRRLALLGEAGCEERLLDVGGGYGYLADAAAGRSAERWVVELSESAARRVSPDHRVVVGAFPDVDLPQDHFDVVSLQDCFEHLPDPHAALEKLRSVLRPGGRLLIVTPDTGSWLARVQGRSWVSLKFPEHVVLHSAATLRRALEGAGFRVVRTERARQVVRLDFLASRALVWPPRLGARLERWLRRAGAGRVRLNVPSGSIAVVAEVDKRARLGHKGGCARIAG